MKITHNKVGQNLNTKETGKAEKSDKAGAAAVGGQKGNAAALQNADLGATKVDLSPRAQEMKKIKETAMAAPDIREDKVAALQKMIDEGKYNVSAKDIADKMVDEELQWS
ncbi:MAG: flagellar biosynthesis anti-sigma factor FlgM [Pseudobdellovibrionaceae bacterium]